MLDSPQAMRHDMQEDEEDTLAGMAASMDWSAQGPTFVQLLPSDAEPIGLGEDSSERPTRVSTLVVLTACPRPMWQSRVAPVHVAQCCCILHWAYGILLLLGSGTQKSQRPQIDIQQRCSRLCCILSVRGMPADWVHLTCA